MTHFDGKGDINIYLALFQRQIAMMNIAKENWAIHLLNFPIEYHKFYIKRTRNIVNNYDRVNNLLFKRFKLTSETFWEKIISHKKDPSANWRDLASQLRHYLEEWVNRM